MLSLNSTFYRNTYAWNAASAQPALTLLKAGRSIQHPCFSLAKMNVTFILPAFNKVARLARGLTHSKRNDCAKKLEFNAEVNCE